MTLNLDEWINAKNDKMHVHGIPAVKGDGKDASELRLKNYERLFDRARFKVRSWEKTHGYTIRPNPQ